MQSTDSTPNSPAIQDTAEHPPVRRPPVPVEVRNNVYDDGEVEPLFVDLPELDAGGDGFGAALLTTMQDLVAVEKRRAETEEQIASSLHVLVELKNGEPAELERRGLGVSADPPPLFDPDPSGGSLERIADALQTIATELVRERGGSRRRRRSTSGGIERPISDSGESDAREAL